MSSIKLCLAGLLVACGLVLGTFTLHGYFDPQWEASQRPQAGAQPADATPAIQPFRGRSQFVARKEEPSDRHQDKPSVPVRRVSTDPSPTAAAPKKAARRAAVASRRPSPRKKVVDRARAEPPQQQASFQWPWNLFNN